jgi:hypothetical protein
MISSLSLDIAIARVNGVSDDIREAFLSLRALKYAQIMRLWGL